MTIRESAQVIAPTVLTDAMLVSSTSPETDYAAHAPGTNYALDACCILTATHRVYKSLQAGNLGHDPAASPTWWQDIGPTNRHAMFDNVVGTRTSVASALTVVLRPGGIGGLALMELVGREVTVTMKDAPAGAVAYTRTVSLDGTIIESVFDWFFQPYEQRTDVIFTDIPNYFQLCELTISIVTSSGNAECGVCKFGEVIRLSAIEYGATLGILDFSRKERDTWGRYVVVERDFSKKSSQKIITKKSDFNRIFRRLASLRSRLCVWIATDAAGYEPLMIYGFYRDFSIDVAYPTMHYCSLEIEGMI